MHVFSYGDPSILSGRSGGRMKMDGRRKCNDCDECVDGWTPICWDDGYEDCDPYCLLNGRQRCKYHDD